MVKNKKNLFFLKHQKTVFTTAPLTRNTLSTNIFTNIPNVELPLTEDARETRFLCTINASLQSRIQALVEMWDRGRHSTLRAELIQGRDLIVMQSEWWSSIPCPRRHGWWVQSVDSVILTRCKGCSGMVQITLMDPVSKTCHSCRSRAEPNNAGSAPKPKTSIRFCPPGAKRRRTRKISPESDLEPYSVMRPLDDALPEELDLEGWDSDDDRDNRGPETCLSPSPVQQVRKKRKGSGALPTRSSPPYSPLVNLGPPPSIKLCSLMRS